MVDVRGDVVPGEGAALVTAGRGHVSGEEGMAGWVLQVALLEVVVVGSDTHTSSQFLKECWRHVVA